MHTNFHHHLGANMTHLHRLHLLSLTILLHSAATATPATPELLWLPLNETGAQFVADRSPQQLEGDLANIKWAKTAFGSAPLFCGTNSFIEIPPVPGLDKASHFTIAMWALWDGEATRYPNLLSTKNWSPGGLMFFVTDNSCSFRLGRPGERAGAPNNAWRETGLPLLNKLPQRQWVHLCATFAQPQLTTYVNGQQVAQGKWDYPVEAQGLRLGGWHSAVTHRGLLSDLRLYNRALPPTEVAQLAQDQRYQSGTYSIIDEPLKDLKAAVTLANKHVTLKLDEGGRAISLREKGSGRELLITPTPLVHVTYRDGLRATARAMRQVGKNLIFSLSNQRGEITMQVQSHTDFFSFKVLACSVTNAATLNFCTLAPAVKKYVGGMANMLSDDESGVCLRAIELPLDMSANDNQLRVWGSCERPVVDWQAALVAGPKAKLPKMLQAVARHYQVPTSQNCGPWALGAEANRGSYLFADLAHAATDDWIEVARRGGFSTIHLHGWWRTLGHYHLNQRYFPNGMSDLQNTVERIHAAGLRVGIHTLTGCIDTRDTWVTPIPSPHLIPFHSYTLAADLPIDATTLLVNEVPAAHHDTVFTYSGNGNAIRVNQEIIQYSEISRTPPYAFRACKRGAFGTQPAAHKAGDQADYLQQRYMAFYPQPDSPLADDLAACIANVFNTCHLDQIYFDGSEGMMSRYGIDVMRHKIFKRLQGQPLAEASCHGAHNWWLHSRLGAWDHPVWAPKRFQDKHIATSAMYRDSDLLEPQMGWWAPRGPTAIGRGHFLDDMEYFACKNLGLDSASSIQGINVSHAPLPLYIEQQITLLGWYEHLRLARYFDAPTIERIAVPGAEFRLRQAADGTWLFTPLVMHTHRFTHPQAHWSCNNPYPTQPLSLRLEALYAAAPYNHAEAVPLLSTNDFPNFTTATASGNVKLDLQTITTNTHNNTHNLRLTAINRSSTSAGAWARAELKFPDPYRNLNNSQAFALWVKGDGSGALLNIQLGTPREYMHATSDHYVTLDFTGWRYVELLPRERDVAHLQDNVWPYGGAYTIYRTPLNMRHISHLSLYLNALPPGANVEVTLTPINAMPTRKITFAAPCITLNDQSITLPYTLTSGDFVELEPDGYCTHFNEQGLPLARQSLAAPYMVKGGSNHFSFACPPATNGTPRAELSLNFFGEKFGTQNPKSRIDRTYMRHEYAMPLAITTPDNAPEIFTLAVRPQERARLEIEISGAVLEPTLAWADHTVRFPVEIKESQRLLCRDGKTWQLLDAKRQLCGSGTLPSPIPLLDGGSHQITFTSRTRTQPIIKLLKVYTK